MENRGYPYALWGKELLKYIKTHFAKEGNYKVTMESLSDMTGVPLDTLKKYFSGRIKPNITILLYFVFALKLNSYQALSFLSSFGFSVSALKYPPFQDFYQMILKNCQINDSQTPKAFVDEIIKQTKIKYKDPKK